MIRWNKEESCFEGHDGKKWKCLDYKITEDFGNPLLELEGGKILKYNNEQGWKENDGLPNSKKNVIN